MAKQIACRDVGLDCDFEATGETVDEIMEKASAHAMSAHGIQSIPPELAAQVQAAIKDI